MIRDVESAIRPGEARRRIEAVDEHLARFCNSVAVTIPKQDHLIRRFATRARTAHQQIGNPRGQASLVLGGSAGQRDQNVAVRQGLQGTRMVQPVGKALHLKAFRGIRHFAFLPADRLGDCNGREAFGIRFIETRIGTHHLVERNVGRVAARDEEENDPEDHDHDEKGDAQLLEDAHAIQRYASKA